MYTSWKWSGTSCAVADAIPDIRSNGVQELKRTRRPRHYGCLVSFIASGTMKANKQRKKKKKEWLKERQKDEEHE